MLAIREVAGAGSVGDDPGIGRRGDEQVHVNAAQAREMMYLAGQLWRSLPVFSQVARPVFVADPDGHDTGFGQPVRRDVAGHEPPVERAGGTRPADVVAHEQVDGIFSIKVLAEQQATLPVSVV